MQDVHVLKPSGTVQSCVAVIADCILNSVELFLRILSEVVPTMELLYMY